MSNKSRNYLAWDIDAKNFPKDGSIGTQIQFLTGYGTLAPSTYNTQPWLFEITDNILTIKPDPSKELSVADPDKTGLYVSLGACAENIVQAAEYFGIKAAVDVSENIIKITFKTTNASNRPTNDSGLSNILSRHSDKFEYIRKEIPDDIVRKLRLCGEPNVTIDLIDKGPMFDDLAENHLSASRRIADKEGFRMELANWLRPNNTRRYDGMPGSSVGMSNIQSLIAPHVIKKMPKLFIKKLKNYQSLLYSSSSLVLVSVQDAKVSNDTIVNAGRSIERLWLKATELGLVAQPLFASIQDKMSRTEIKRLITKKKQPVFLMRIGYSKSNQQVLTPRLQPNNVPVDMVSKIRSTIRTPVDTRQMVIGKYRINYAVAGAGKPLLLIHGANIGWVQWHLNIESLAKKFTVYAIDLPGAGNSTLVNFHKTDFEKDYVEIVDQFIQRLNLKKLDIVGSSFGGWIAMRLAIQDKSYINRLIVANPIGFTRHMPVKFRPIAIRPIALLASKTALRPKRNNKNLDKFMRDVFYDKSMPLKDEFVNYFYTLCKASHNVLFISRLAHYSGMRTELFLGQSLKKIQVPTLVIWGKEDPLMPYDTVQNNFRLIPNISITALEKVGHMPPVEAPEQVNELITTYLANK